MADRWTYRPPSLSAWIHRVRRGRGPVTRNLVPVPDFVQWTYWTPIPVGTAMRFLNATIAHGPGPPSPYVREPYGGRPETYTWDFGDGSPPLVQQVLPTGYPLLAEHTYASPGLYNVSLTACNSAGCATLVRYGYARIVLPFAASIRQLRDYELLSVRLTEGQGPTAALRQRKAVSAGIRLGRTCSIRRLRSDSVVSARLRSINV